MITLHPVGSQPDEDKFATLLLASRGGYDSRGRQMYVITYRPEWMDANGYLTGFLEAVLAQPVEEINVRICGLLPPSDKAPAKDEHGFALRFQYYRSNLGVDVVIQELSPTRRARIQRNVISVEEKGSTVLRLVRCHHPTNGTYTWERVSERRTQSYDVPKDMIPVDRLYLYGRLNKMLREKFAKNDETDWAACIQRTYLEVLEPSARWRFSKEEVEALNLGPVHAFEAGLYDILVKDQIPVNFTQVIQQLREIYSADTAALVREGAKRLNEGGKRLM